MLSPTHNSLSVVGHHIEHCRQLVCTILFHRFVDNTLLHVHHYRQRPNHLKPTHTCTGWPRNVSHYQGRINSSCWRRITSIDWIYYSCRD